MVVTALMAAVMLLAESLRIAAARAAAARAAPSAAAAGAAPTHSGSVESALGASDIVPREFARIGGTIWGSIRRSFSWQLYEVRTHNLERYGRQLLIEPRPMLSNVREAAAHDRLGRGGGPALNKPRKP